MDNKTFREAYKAAADELESLLKDQERIEERILSLRKTMNALATLISQHDGKDKNFMDYAEATLREMIDTTISGDIQKIVSAAKRPLTASEIRSELNELGGSMAEQSNPLATIHAVLNRLSESDRVRETIKDGKKAWEGIRLVDRVRAANIQGATVYGWSETDELPGGQLAALADLVGDTSKKKKLK